MSLALFFPTSTFFLLLLLLPPLVCLPFVCVCISFIVVRLPEFVCEWAQSDRDCGAMTNKRCLKFLPLAILWRFLFLFLFLSLSLSFFFLFRLSCYINSTIISRFSGYWTTATRAKWIKKIAYTISLSVRKIHIKLQPNAVVCITRTFSFIQHLWWIFFFRLPLLLLLLFFYSTEILLLISFLLASFICTYV